MADPSKTATAVIILLQAVTVSLSPSTVSLAPSGTQQFTPTVLGTSNTAVTWSINPSVGTISSAGLYTAPSSILTSQTVTVTAQSVTDPTKSASATVSLKPPVTISVNPSTTLLTASQTQQFTATVTGTTNTGVTWSLSPAMGTLTTFGFYTAPVNVLTAQTVTVTVQSVADPAKSASAVISLQTTGTFTYYVDSANGLDSNPGTLAKPWQTTAKVNATKLSPGQSVGFKRGGVWRERLISSSSGVAGSPITFGAYGSGAKPLFLGSTLIPSWTIDSGAVYKATGVTWTANMVFGDSVYVSKAASRSSMTAGTFYLDTGTNLLYVWLATGDDPSRHTMEVSNNSDYPYGMVEDGYLGNSYLVFDNLGVKYANWAAFRVYGGQHVTIQNCTIEYSYNNPIIAIGTSQGAPANPDGFVATDNVISHTGLYRLKLGAAGAEAIALDGSNVFSVRRNSIDTNYGEGIVAINGAQNGDISDNVITNQQMSGGIYLTVSGGLTVHNIQVTRNTIKNGTAGAAVVALGIAVEGTGTISNIDVTYNLIYNYPSGIGIVLGNSEGAINGVRVLNNTVSDVAYAFLEQGNSKIANNIIENNIFAGTVVGLEVTAGSSTSNTLNYDLCLPTAGVPFYWFGTYYNFASFKTASGQNGNGLNANPLFTNAGAGDFTLQAGSPAIGAGVYIAGVSTANPPNIGAK